MSATTAEPHPAPQGLAGVWLLLAVLLGYWAVAIHRLSGMWTALPEYNYGWLVPMLCAMLFWERWRRRPAPVPPAQPGPALVFVAPALVVFLLARLGHEVILNWRIALWALAGAVAVMTWSALWLVGGRRWVGHFFFPVAFLFLAIPWPDRFEGPFIQFLTQVNASTTVEVLSFAGMPAVRLGNLILIEPGLVGVQEACSGLRSFQSTLMVSLFLGELFRFNLWRRLTFVVLGAGLSMLFNIVRTSFLVWACHSQGLGAVDKFHDPAGWSVFAASFTGLAVIGWWLNRSAARQMPAPGEPAPSPVPLGTVPGALAALRPGLVVFLGAGLLLAEGAVQSWFATHSRVRQPSMEWRVAGQELDQRKDLPITREVRAMLAFDEGRGWEWSGSAGDRWQAFYFSWAAPTSLGRKILSTSGALGHLPELCFTRAGMQLRQIYGRRRYAANGVPLVFKVYEFADRNVPIFVFACTWERGTEQRLDEGLVFGGEASTWRALRETWVRAARGDNGIVDEVRVFKLGVWGPRTIAEAEAAFQTQLNRLVLPAPTPGVSASARAH